MKKTKKSDAQITKLGLKANIAIVRACDAVQDLIWAKGEDSSQALITGYISMMATRIMDDIKEDKEKDE